MSRFWFALALILLTAASASAQTPAVPTGVDILVLPPGSPPATGTPIASRITTIGAAMPDCNLPSVPAPGPTPLINPTTVYFDDPYTAGRFCRAPLPGGLPPAVDYIAVAVFLAASGNSERSLAGIPPFTVQALPPPVPTSLVIRP